MSSELDARVILDKEMLIGHGRDRACYHHPDEADKCIKISIVKNDKQSRREPKYYTKLQADNINWGAIAEYRGKINTNLGEGLVFDLVKDFDGSTSKAITYYLLHGLISQEQLSRVLEGIKKYVFKYNIISRDISANNLLYRRETETEGKLIIIDGLGNAELIPLSNYFKYLAHKKITRKWCYLIMKMRKDFPNYNFDQS